MVSGSNCCRPGTVHLFLRRPDGTFAARRDLEVERPPEYAALRGLDRSHSRPFLLDWYRDGRTALVVASSGGWRFQVCPGPLAGRTHFRPTDFDLPNPPDTRPLEFEFTDWDGDGAFDLLVSVQHRDAPNGPWVYSIDWLRNTAPRGEPVFAAPERLVTVPIPWEVNGFSAFRREPGDLPGIVVGVTKDWKRNPGCGWTVDSQFWVYRRK